MNDQPKPALIFFLSSFKGFNTGVGGHYRSVAEVSKMLSTHYETHIITFGNIPSPVFSEFQNHHHVEAWSSVWPASLRKLRTIVREIEKKQPRGSAMRMVSTGLNNDYAPMRISTMRMGARYFHVKPGGKPATSSRVFNGIPIAVFHDDDRRAFKAADPYRAVVVTPGRVSVPSRDEEFLAKARSPAYLSGAINIACVMRISDYYEDSIMMVHQSLASATGVTFTHYGTVQSSHLLERLRSAAPAIPYALVTDPLITSMAAKALHPFQAFVGLGRSAIEALSLSIPTFVPVRTSDTQATLVAVTSSNWQTFSRANFTARVSFSDLREAGAIITMDDAAADPAVLQQLRQDSKQIYADNFSPESSKSTWLEFLSGNHFRGGYMDIVRALLLARSELKRALIIQRAEASK